MPALRLCKGTNPTVLFNKRHTYDKISFASFSFAPVDKKIYQIFIPQLSLLKNWLLHFLFEKRNLLNQKFFDACAENLSKICENSVNSMYPSFGCVFCTVMT